jgi:hypothetical protein
MTGLESLLGQALTLDDEPTLVRAVKAVKRNMARDKHLHRAYAHLAISTTATLLLGLSTKFSRFQGGLSAAYIAWGVARVALDYRIPTLLTSILALLFGVIMGLPVSGLVIPYHPILLRLYDPRIQNTLRAAGAILLVGVLARDAAIVVTMKLDRRKVAAEEERKRQERVKGIFYAKPAPAGGRSVNLWNGGGTVRERGRDGGHSKSKSMFSTMRY